MNLILSHGRVDGQWLCGSARLLGVPVAERISADPLGGLRVLPLDVLLQACALDAPLPPAADLDRGQFPATHHVVDLRVRDVELGSHVGEQQESRLHGSNSQGWHRLLEFATKGPTPDRPRRGFLTRPERDTPVRNFRRAGAGCMTVTAY